MIWSLHGAAAFVAVQVAATNWIAEDLSNLMCVTDSCFGPVLCEPTIILCTFLNEPTLAPNGHYSLYCPFELALRLLFCCC